MFGIEWLKPAVFFGSILFAIIGVIVLWLCFVIVDKLTPQKLWEEISEKGNLALAIFMGAAAIAIGQIIAAAIHG
jgi:putative membrane protein